MARGIIPRAFCFDSRHAGLRAVRPHAPASVRLACESETSTPKFRQLVPELWSAGMARTKVQAVGISAGRPTIFSEVPHLRSLPLAARRTDRRALRQRTKPPRKKLGGSMCYPTVGAARLHINGMRNGRNLPLAAQTSQPEIARNSSSAAPRIETGLAPGGLR